MALPVDRKDLVKAVKARAAGDDPLERLVAALAVQTELDALAGEVVQRFVRKAREAGLSWSRIGGALGVTKQAVQQRFTERPVVDAAGGATARRAGAARTTRPPVDLALERAGGEARRAGARQVGTGHLAAALVPVDGQVTTLAAAALGRLGLDDGARDALGGRTEGAAPVTGRTTRTTALTDAVARARDVAASRGADAPDTGDLLLVLADEVGALGGPDAAAVAEEVARLRRWGFADA